MKQVVLDYKSGKVEPVDVPAPLLKARYVLVRTVASLVSVGREKYLLEIGRKSLLSKAMARPDLVRQAIAKAQAVGSGGEGEHTFLNLCTPAPICEL